MEESKLSQAVGFIKEQLKDGRKASRDVEEAYQKQGISYMTFRRAKVELKVKSRKVGKIWMLSLT